MIVQHRWGPQISGRNACGMRAGCRRWDGMGWDGMGWIYFSSNFSSLFRPSVGLLFDALKRAVRGPYMCLFGVMIGLFSRLVI